MSDDLSFVCPVCKQPIRHVMGMTLGEVLSLRHNNQNQAVKIDVLKMDVNAKDARIAELEAALKEVHRRTGLLMTQNQGRWNMSLEHDRRTADVLSVNQDISSAALENKHD